MTDRLIGTCVFAQSGGPTAVINASAYGVIRAALDADEITGVFGAAHGIRGVLDGVLFDMGREDPHELSLLRGTPSSELGACRYKFANVDEDKTDYIRLLDTFKKYNVKYFFINGGNDSMDTCNKVSAFLNASGYECRVIGVPKTIDNDIAGTDHCPGFGSAAKYIATSVAEIYKDTYVYDTGIVTVVEVMGRHAGWLAGAASLAKISKTEPDFIYLPETDFDMARFLTDVESVYKRKNKCLVVVSEGIHYANGLFVSDSTVSETDGFGHAQLGGVAAILANTVKRHLNSKVRGIELSLLQRCASHIASQTDIDEAYLVGRSAVEAALRGETDKMVSLVREPGGTYSCGIELVPLSVSANAEKKVPREWINKAENGVTDEFISYVLPLIQGEYARVLENGLPRFAQLAKIRA